MTLSSLYQSGTGTLNIPGNLHVGGSIYGVAPPVVEDVTGTTYTVVPGDAGKIKRFTNVAGCAITLTTASSGISTDLLLATGVGAVTLVLSGVTVNGSTSSPFTLGTDHL